MHSERKKESNSIKPLNRSRYSINTEKLNSNNLDMKLVIQYSHRPCLTIVVCLQSHELIQKSSNPNLFATTILPICKQLRHDSVYGFPKCHKLGFQGGGRSFVCSLTIIYEFMATHYCPIF